MNPRAHLHTPGLLLALLLAVSACGSTVDAEYPGEPLLTLEGRMTLAPGTTVDGPVRIALVWYPRWFVVPLFLGDTSVAEDAAVVAEDQPYEGTFPSSFRFNIYRPPSSSTHWTTADGEDRQMATGILLAYQDLNGNGKLDTIASTGHPVDRVLGSTMMYGADTMYTLVYTNMEKTLMPGLELKKGFNLLKWAGSVSVSQPLTEPIPLEVTSGGPQYDMLVCRGWFDGVDSQVREDLCGIPGLIEPDVEEPPPTPAELIVDIDVRRTGDRARVFLNLQRGDTLVTVEDAQVTLDGLALTYNPKDWRRYESPESDLAPLLEGGTMWLDITWGEKNYHRLLTFPGRFELLAPAPGSHVKIGAPFEIRWTRPSDVSFYLFTVKMPYQTQGWYALMNDVSSDFTLHESWMTTGPAILEFSAVTVPPDDELPDMQIQVQATLEVPITVDP